jgi:hypothetical protein
MEKDNDIFFEMDACVSNTTEWEMWDVIRFLYDPIKIPKAIQLSVYTHVSTISSPLIFNSFHFHTLIRQWSDQYDSIVDTDFTLYQTHIHTEIVQYILNMYPHLMEYTQNDPDVVFFAYDHKLERFVIFTTDMDVARGIHHSFETFVKQVLPFVFLQKVALFLSDEFDEPLNEPNIDTEDETSTDITTQQPNISICEWMRQLVYKLFT